MATRDPRGDGTGVVTTGGGTELMARPAAVHPNASSQTRPDVPPMLGKLAAWSWRLLVVLVAAGLLLYRLIQLKVIVVPALLRCADLGQVEAATSVLDQIARASSSNATATRRLVGSSTASS
jgi:hypothetical protein